MKIHYHKGILSLSVDEKLKAASYFLEKLRKVKKKHKNLVLADPMEISCLLDGFLFEIIGAKEAFIYELSHATNNLLEDRKINERNLLGELKKEQLPNQKYIDILNKIIELKKKRNSWLWRLNGYRNISAHRSLLKVCKKFQAIGDLSKEKATKIEITSPITSLPWETISLHTKQPKSGSKKNSITLFPYGISLLKNWEEYCTKEEGPPGEPLEQDIISYCEESLVKMRQFLKQLQKEIRRKQSNQKVKN